jgi:hypothetical protein
MPRKARLTVTGAIHHLMSRGNEGMLIFIDAESRISSPAVLAMIREGEMMEKRKKIILYAYTLCSHGLFSESLHLGI